VGQPVLAEQGGDLGALFAGHQAQVGGDHLQLAPVEFDLHPQRAAGLQQRHLRQGRQGGGPDQPHGQGGQHGVAVALLGHLHGGVEVEAHAELLGERMGLVDATAAVAADVQFLQGDDVRPATGDHLGHAVDVQPPVGPQALVDVVGQDTGHEPVRAPRLGLRQGERADQKAMPIARRPVLDS